MPTQPDPHPTEEKYVTACRVLYGRGWSDRQEAVAHDAWRRGLSIVNAVCEMRAKK